MAQAHGSRLGRQLPIDLRLAPGLQVFVGAGEMAAAEKAPVGGEWRGVRRGQDEVRRTVDDCPLALGMGASKQEDQAFPPGIERFHDLSRCHGLGGFLENGPNPVYD